MVLGLRLKLRTISQRHRKENERAAQRGNGHHPVDAQSWNEETHGCRNNHRGRICAADQNTADRANRVHKTARGDCHNAGVEWPIKTARQRAGNVGDEQLTRKKCHNDTTKSPSHESCIEQGRLTHPASSEHLCATELPSRHAKKESGSYGGSLCQAYSGALADRCDDPTAKSHLRS